jgi:hypothetical protein
METKELLKRANATNSQNSTKREIESKSGIKLEVYGPAERFRDNMRKVKDWDSYEKGIRIRDNKWEC